MKNIKLFNKIDKIGTDCFDAAEYTLSENAESPDAVLVRSANMLEVEFNPELKSIARAGAGVNNIPIDRCSKAGVVVFNTPGANANGVKELAVAALMLSSRNIIGSASWSQTLSGKEDVEKLVEKGKSEFAGPEVKGKTLGVIGLGAIGGPVANTAYALGMNVIGYDKYMTVSAAWGLSRAVKRAAGYDDIFANSDYITIHIPSTPESRNLINAEALSKMKDGVRIINLSRGDIVNNADIIAAVKSGKVACYITDFPSSELLGIENIIALPHIGSSTPESEMNCAYMAAMQTIDYIENGNIKNSVNYPETYMPRSADARLVVLHENVPNMLAQILSILSADNINIENMVSCSKNTNAVALFDTNTDLRGNDKIINDIMSVKGVARVIKI